MNRAPSGKPYAQTTATLPATLIGDNAKATVAVALAGIKQGDMLIVGARAALDQGLSLSNYGVFADGTLTLEFLNESGGAVTPAAPRVYDVIVIPRIEAREP